MRYPEKLLSPGEEIKTQFRPHWSQIVREGVLSLLVLVLIILIAVQDLTWKSWAIAGLALAWLLLVTAGFIRWWTTQHVITNERVIHRTGLISKKGKEIPLEVINDVAFSQRAWERVFGTGDLLIESAGTHGQSRYSNIPHPEAVQSIIYQEREGRKMELESGGRGVAESPASQLAVLSKLHDEGKLTDLEFEAEKRKLLGGS
ncbi:MAG TPA: PH domain-containing protein [Acidimicrobiia bacterium]|nr:PH domain-containing protein [Acidimicrobiia bacterium]